MDSRAIDGDLQLLADLPADSFTELRRETSCLLPPLRSASLRGILERALLEGFAELRKPWTATYQLGVAYSSFRNGSRTNHWQTGANFRIPC